MNYETIINDLYFDYFYEGASDSFKEVYQKAAKILKMDIKDLPKYITTVKRKYKMKKLKKEFDMKHIKENGKLVRTITIDGKTIKMYRLGSLVSTREEKQAYSAIGSYATTVKDSTGLISGPPSEPIILVDNAFFDMNIDLQRFILYHEFGHLRLHLSDSDIMGNEIPDKVKKDILEDLFVQQWDGTIKREDIYKNPDIKNEFDKYMKDNNFKKFCNDDNITSSKYRERIREYFKKEIKNDKKLKKTIEKYNNDILKKYKNDQENRDGIKERLDRSANMIYSHFTPTELEADDFARRKMGNRAVKGISKLEKYSSNIANKQIRYQNSSIAMINNDTKKAISNLDKEIKNMKKELRTTKDPSKIAELKQSISNNQYIKKQYKENLNANRTAISLNNKAKHVNAAEPKARKRILKKTNTLSKITPAPVKEAVYESGTDDFKVNIYKKIAKEYYNLTNHKVNIMDAMVINLSYENVVQTLKDERLYDPSYVYRGKMFIKKCENGHTITEKDILGCIFFKYDPLDKSGQNEYVDSYSMPARASQTGIQAKEMNTILLLMSGYINNDVENLIRKMKNEIKNIKRR